MVEHQNNYVKDLVRHQGANLTFMSAQVASRSALPFEKIMKNIDHHLRIKPESDKHAMANRRNDTMKIANHLLASDIANNKPGRIHNSFPKLQGNLSSLHPDKILTVCSYSF